MVSNPGVTGGYTGSSNTVILHLYRGDDIFLDGCSSADSMVRNFKTTHYANMSVQYTAIFHGCKNNNFQMKIFDIFLIFAQNID